MTGKLQNDLVKRYAEFFAWVEELPKEHPIIPIQFGIECEDAWYTILDNLMQEIQDHLHHVNNEKVYKSKFWRQWFRNTSSFGPKFMRKNRFTIWLEHKIWKLTKDKLKSVKREELYGKIPFNVTQIKDKYGGLRFYYDGGDENIDAMVSLTESLSYRTCEFCGTTRNVEQTDKGWIYTVCKRCRRTRKQFKNENDKNTNDK